jgi:hypothetical protein
MGRILNTSQQKITAIKKSRKNNGGKTQPHAADDGELQDDEEQPREPHNRAGGAWRYRAHAGIVSGKIEAIVMKREVKCELSRPSVYAPTHSSDVHPASDGQRPEVYRSDEGGEPKTPEARMHVSLFRKTARVPLSQQDQDPSEIADICGFHRKKCSTRSNLQETRRARAQSPDGTPAQRVERLKEGWSDVRASTGKRGTTMHDLRVHLGSLRRASRTETCKRAPPNSRIPTTEKNKERKDR